MRSMRVWALMGVATSMLACNAITGASDLATGTGEVGADGGTATGGPRSDGDSGVQSDAEGGTGSEPAIAPSLASCGTGSICLPSTSTWSPALSLVTDVSSCPASWPMRTSYKTSGGGSCDCSCAPNAGSSCGGAIVSKSGTACGGTPTTYSPPTVGGCEVLATPLSLPISLTAAPDKPPSSCTGTVSSKLEAPRNTSVCTGATPASSTECKADEVCLPKPGLMQGAISCIMHDGEVACPSRMPVRRVVGSSVSDGRSCGTTCTCETNGCAGGKVETFSTTDCMSSVRSLDVNGSCTINGTPLTNVVAYEYTPSSGCAVKDAPAVLGTENVTAPRTLCCAFGF
jgi:hypothetical protein